MSYCRAALLLLLYWCCGMPAAAGFGAPITERIDPLRLGGVHPTGFVAHEDADGVIFLANLDGLVRVGGNRTQLFPLGSNALVRTLLPLEGRLYVGGYDAWGEFSPGSDGRPRLLDLSRPDGEPLGTVWSLLHWRDALWIITSNRVLIHENGVLRELPTPARTTAAFVLADRLYLRADGLGLFVLDEAGTEFRPVVGAAMAGDGPSRSPLPWKDGVLLASEKHGLLHFDGQQLRPWPTEPLQPLQTEQPYVLHALQDGRLLVGTLAGRLHLIDAEGVWQQAHELVAAPILGISESREGGLLVSTERGVYRVYWPSAWERVGAGQGVEGIVRTLQHRGNAIWLATSTGLYRRDDRASVDAAFARLTADIVDLRALDWVGSRAVVASDAGLQYWLEDPSAGRLGVPLDVLGSCYSVLPSLVHVDRMYAVCDDGLIVASAVDPARPHVLALIREELARTAALEEIDADTLIVTLLDGPPMLLELAPDGALLTRRTVRDGLSDPDTARVLYSGSAHVPDRYRLLADGRAWAWTGTRWVAHSDPWPVELGDGQDFRVLLDAQGNELLLSRRGLALRLAGAREWRRVSLPGGDGVQIVGGSVLAGLYLWDQERIWHAQPDVNGIPGLFAEPVRRRMQLDRLQLRDGQTTRLLPVDDDHLAPLNLGAQLTVDFSLPTLAQPVQFRSRLGAPDRPGEFSAWTADATRVLPPLPRGRYRLEIEGRNALGVTAEPVRLDFEVIAPWWHSRMLQLLVALAIAALLSSGVLALRSMLLKRRYRVLEQLVHERTAALSAANHQLTLLADRDGLTGLLNRRRFDADWSEALTQAVIDSRPVALLLVDLDHFKQYNDRHGHLLGDERLRACADWLAAQAAHRPATAAYRYGGEEFATILRDISPSDAVIYAQTLCTGAADRFGLDGTTLSIGLRCAVPDGSDDPLRWIADVDDALYAAKHAGRNCVRVHPCEEATDAVAPVAK